MKRTKLIFTFLFFVWSQNIFAQGGAIADLKFEEAETAFNNKNYKNVITKLDEFDKLFGSITDRSLYLRITCQNQLFENIFYPGIIGARLTDAEHPSKGITVIEITPNSPASKAGVMVNDNIVKVDDKNITNADSFFETIKSKSSGDVVKLGIMQNSGYKELGIILTSNKNEKIANRLYIKESNYELLSSLRKNSNAYLREMEKDGLNDKYREVYTISENLKKYPKDKQAWLKEKQRIEAELIYNQQQAEAKKQLRLAKIKEYDNKKDRYYREIAPKIDAWEYKEGIKIGMNLKELKASKKDWFKDHFTLPRSDGGVYSQNKKYDKEHYGDRLDGVTSGKNELVNSYDFSIINTRYSNKGAIKNTIEQLKEYFGPTLVFEEAKSGEMSWYVIRSPYAKSKIALQTYTSTYDKSNVNIIKTEDLNSYGNAVFPDYLDRYLGHYSAEGVLKIAITKNDFQLFCQIEGKEKFLLSRKEKDKYSYEKGGLIIEFNPELGTAVWKQKDGKTFFYAIED